MKWSPLSVIAIVPGLVLLGLMPSPNRGFAVPDDADIAAVYGGRCYEQIDDVCPDADQGETGENCVVRVGLDKGAPVLIGLPCLDRDQSTKCYTGAQPTTCGEVWTLKVCNQPQ
jgi:hypothetical protein